MIDNSAIDAGSDTTLALEFVDINKEARELAATSTSESSKHRSAEFIKDVSEVSRNLKTGENAKRIPIRVFKNIFLPIFTGAINEDDNPAEFHRIYNAYLVHADSIYNDVPVVDANDNVVFMIPALCNIELASFTADKLMEAGTPSFKTIWGMSESIKASGRISEAQNINEEYFARTVPDTKDAIIRHLIYATRWNDICEYCQVPPIYPTLKEKMDALATANSDVNPSKIEATPQNPEDYNPDIDDFI